MSDLRARFAAEIKVARQSAGLTQEQLAEATGTSVDFLSKLERGLNSPSLETLAAIVKALALDPVRVLQAEPDGRDITIARHALESRAAQVVRHLDDPALLALIGIGHALERLTVRPTAQRADKGPSERK